MAQTTLTSPTPAAASWRSRLGLRSQIVAAVLLIAIVAAIAGNAYLSQQLSPAGAVREYLGALSRGDGGGAWAAMQVADSGQPADAKLLSRQALAAALATGHPQYPQLSIDRTTTTALATLVDASYRQGNATAQLTLTVQRDPSERRFGFYPLRRVVVTPSYLKINLPAGGGGLAIDGQALSLTAGKDSSVAVFPLAHRVQLQASQMLQEQVLTVPATASPQPIPVVLQPKFTDAGAAKAGTASIAAITACAAATSASPNNCPQSVTDASVQKISWQLVGKATVDAVGFDAQGKPFANGHYQIIASEQRSYGNGTFHVAAGGAYLAQLTVGADSAEVAKLGATTGIPTLQRPAAAADQPAKDLVKVAFSKCSAATTITRADCPQLDNRAIGNIQNIRWTLNGDPTAAATVTFDGDRSVFEVAGSYDMKVSYDLVEFVTSHYTEASSSTRYRADLFWDGSAYQLVAINGMA